jgi:hypothetical protein
MASTGAAPVSGAAGASVLPASIMIVVSSQESALDGFIVDAPQTAHAIARRRAHQRTCTIMHVAVEGRNAFLSAAMGVRRNRNYVAGSKRRAIF